MYTKVLKQDLKRLLNVFKTPLKLENFKQIQHLTHSNYHKFLHLDKDQITNLISHYFERFVNQGKLFCLYSIDFNRTIAIVYVLTNGRQWCVV